MRIRKSVVKFLFHNTSECLDTVRELLMITVRKVQNICDVWAKINAVRVVLIFLNFHTVAILNARAFRAGRVGIPRLNVQIKGSYSTNNSNSLSNHSNRTATYKDYAT